jgi:hypothetical protein
VSLGNLGRRFRKKVSAFMIAGDYTGPLVDGVREGKGTLQWNNGDKYEGMFKGGLRHGQVIHLTLHIRLHSFCLNVSHNMVGDFH